MKVEIMNQKKKRCYSCNKYFEPYSLTRSIQEPKTIGKVVLFKLDIYSLKGRRVGLCPTCKIQKFLNLGDTLKRSKYKISRTTVVRMEPEV
jgi:hypothetical protein